MTEIIQQENNSLTNMLIVLLLLALVGFGVWYFVKKPYVSRPVDDTNDNGGSLEINIGGGSDTPSQGGGAGAGAEGGAVTN